MPNITEINFKTTLLEPLLHYGFTKEGWAITSVLSECSFCIPLIISIMEDCLISKDHWKSLVSGLRIIKKRNLRLSQGLEVPNKYLKILNKCLKHKLKTVRREALNSIFITASIIYVENLLNREYFKKEIKNFKENIDQEIIGNAVNLKEFANSFHWQRVCMEARLKWEHPDVKPDFNTELYLKVMRLFWPGFQP